MKRGMVVGVAILLVLTFMFVWNNGYTIGLAYAAPDAQYPYNWGEGNGGLLGPMTYPGTFWGPLATWQGGFPGGAGMGWDGAAASTLMGPPGAQSFRTMGYMAWSPNYSPQVLPMGKLNRN